MKRNLFNIGIGGFGARLSSEVTRKMRGNGASVTFIAIDSDFSEINEITCDYKLDLSVPERFSDTLERLENENVRIFSEEISTLGYVKTLPMDKGANSWRIKAMASFITYMSDVENKQKFDEFLDSFSFSADDSYVFNVFTSLAGGTGSALFIPLSLYIKKFLKEKGCNKIEFILYGACPDIFAEGLNRELKAKAYANAYASLSELNTINCVALRKNQSNIKIGYENTSVGLLFDGNDKEFHNKERMPFNKVYLFDRLPGIFSTELHLSILSDYIYYQNSGLTAENTVKNCAIIKAYTASEISLDTEDIADYVAKFGVERDLKKEMLKPFSEIERSESSYSIGSSKKVITDETEEYARKVKSYIENLEVGRDEKTSYVLGRLEENDMALTIDDEYWLKSYLENLSNALEERLCTSAYTSVYSELAVEKGEKLSKKEGLSRLNEKIESLYKKLNDYYFSTEESIKNEDYNGLFYGEEKEYSLIENVLIEDGRFIHPTLALIRLSLLYLQIKKRVKIYSKLTEDELEKAEKEKLIPEKLLALDNPTMEATGYGALPSDRFIKLIAKREKWVDEKKLSKKELKAYLKNKKRYVIKKPEDEKLICSDFKGVLENVALERKGYYFNKLGVIVASLLNEYRRTIKEISLLQYHLETEVAEAKKERVTQGVYYGVATDEWQRTNAVKTYAEEIYPNKHFDSDNALGKRVFEYSYSALSREKTESLKYTEELVKTFISDSRERIKKSEFFSELESKNVFRAMLESAKGKHEKTYLKTALMIKPTLVTVNPTEEVEKKTLFVSRDTAEYVLSLKKELMLRAETPEEAVDEFLVSIGEYETEIKIFEGLSNKKAYATSERGGIKISSLSKMNGEKDISIYKNEYEKALENIKKYETPMWNPHIFDCKNGIDLVAIK